MINIKMDKTPDVAILEFYGDLIIENAQEIKRMLLAAMDNNNEMLLTFRDVMTVDISFLQLLCAAHRTAVRAGKIMKLDRRRPEVLRAVAQETGFTGNNGCVLDSRENCLWKEGWEELWAKSS